MPRFKVTTKNGKSVAKMVGKRAKPIPKPKTILSETPVIDNLQANADAPKKKRRGRLGRFVKRGK
jgi:hypothetical protein